MDTATRALTGRVALFLCLLVSDFALGVHSNAAGRPLVIHGADAQELRAVTWALGRFRAARLQGMPAFHVYLHRSQDDCQGSIGRYRAGRIDLCTKDSSEPYAKKFALHEMAHAWTEANVDSGTLDRFMRLRGVDDWNDPRLPWKERGIEQVAEIITWGLGEDAIQPLLPEPADTHELVEAYMLLTGSRPITPSAI